MSLALMPSSLNLKWEGASSAFTITGESSTDWTCRSNCSWCRVSKTGNFTVGVTVERNTGASRTATVTVVCNSGTVSAKVYQRAYEVTYDRSSMIQYYHQTGNEDCALTCVGMCVFKSPQELINAGFPILVQWNDVASAYGYTVTPASPAECTLHEIFNGLKSGYPVIMKTTNWPHWVVVTKYSGTTYDWDKAENYTCADPAEKNNINLEESWDFESKDSYKYIIYKKK